MATRAPNWRAETELSAFVARTSKNDPLAVDAYLATLPRTERESLEALRTLIKDAIPHVEERVSYGTAVMFSLGRDLVGFVSQPKHLSSFMASPTLARAMKSEITKSHKVSGATIRFSIWTARSSGRPLIWRGSSSISKSTITAIARMRGWTGARRNRARTPVAAAQASVRIDGSRTVLGSIRRR